MGLINTLFNNIFAFILTLSVVVFIHELGHYLLARFNKVKVDEFAIGYGKEIFGWNDKNGTRWKICLLPFGGFCKFFGDTDASSSISNTKELNKLTSEEKSKCLYFKTPWQKIQIVAAGPLFNYLLAITLFSTVFIFKGLTTYSNKITYINKDSPSEMANIKVGDRIIAINNNRVSDFDTIKNEIELNNKEYINIKIDRNNKIMIFTIKPEIKISKDIFGNEIKSQLIGIGSDDIVYKKLNIFQAIFYGLREAYNITITTLRALLQMILGQRSINEMSGPIKIAQYSGNALRNGFFVFIYFTAMISTSLGLMNLLPIPVLDGGHIVIYMIELIRRKKMEEKIENTLFKIGFTLLGTLMIFVIIKDFLGIL